MNNIISNEHDFEMIDMNHNPILQSSNREMAYYLLNKYLRESKYTPDKAINKPNQLRTDIFSLNITTPTKVTLASFFE